MILSEKNLWRLTIIFGMAAALIGLSLRYYFVSPLPLNFRYLVHAHSHTMLLGWLLNALLLLLYKAWKIPVPKRHQLLFTLLSICVLGMLLSFPFQGYAAVSITFSTLHIFVSYVLLAKILKLSRGRETSGKLVRTGIIFFFLSTLGPFAMGPLIANEMQSSPWYDQAIFFYLHFQYNGAYLFFMLAIILALRQNSSVQWPEKLFVNLLTIGVILTWFQNLNYSFDPLWINIIGGIGAALELWAGALLFILLGSERLGANKVIVLVLLGVKWIFQIGAAFPAVSTLAANNRFVPMAYLHFIFLGIFTPFIWINLRKEISRFRSFMRGYWLFFLLTEAALVLPSLRLFPPPVPWPSLTFASYVGLVLIWICLGTSWLAGSRQRKPFRA